MIKQVNRFILAFDPSGNYNEGKGTTGWCLYDTETNRIAKFGAIKAVKYNSLMEYWNAHLKLIDDLSGYAMTIVIEDFLLYSNRAESQICSRFETPKLIGMLQYELYLRGIEVILQPAALVKKRWSDDILVYKGLITQQGYCYYIGDIKLSDHCRDAIRHALHYATFRNRKDVSNV